MDDLTELHRQYHQSLGEKRLALREAWDVLCGEAAEFDHVKKFHLLLHRLSGSAGSYGYDSLSSRARKLERDWSAWLDSVESARLPTYFICSRQAGDMADLLDEMAQESSRQLNSQMST